MKQMSLVLMKGVRFPRVFGALALITAVACTGGGQEEGPDSTIGKRQPNSRFGGCREGACTCTEADEDCVCDEDVEICCKPDEVLCGWGCGDPESWVNCGGECVSIDPSEPEAPCPREDAGSH